MVDVSRRYPSACYESSHEKWLLFLNYAIVATPESGGYAYLVILTPELIANTCILDIIHRPSLPPYRLFTLKQAHLVCHNPSAIGFHNHIKPRILIQITPTPPGHKPKRGGYRKARKSIISYIRSTSFSCSRDRIVLPRSPLTHGSPTAFSHARTILHGAYAILNFRPAHP